MVAMGYFVDVIREVMSVTKSTGIVYIATRRYRWIVQTNSELRGKGGRGWAHS